ncbi:MAG: hypothetical protein XU11_C0009G0002 [Candidatus Dadabacteria bacterium CSP1-2]|jgi:hypothetical protein|nr:MAG: hypothetical protein XU11_C0009G0002 [Candidatus Dadabacteria bacterium CSP1-2]MBF8302253.1 hypothetical protein [Candidatus Dadabacteria bacterium]
MKAVTLGAHYDGKQIVLDEPFPLEPNTKLIITVLSKQRIDDERSAWLLLSRQGLENAYGEDEVEYSLDMIKAPNPEYERR